MLDGGRFTGQAQPSEPLNSSPPELASMSGHRRLAAGLLFLAYFTLMVARMAFSALTPGMYEISNDTTATAAQGRVTGLNNTTLGIALALGTAAYLLGKLLLTPAVDLIGGKASLVASCLLCGMFTALMASATSVELLVAWMCLSRVVQAPAWGALIKVGGRMFPASSLGR
jgi:sugar phosphate permease